MVYKDRQLHVVSFDIPFPADYGGVIDVYYKLLALKKQGIKIHLHCFAYGRQKAKELHDISESVHYYPRNVSKARLFNKLPYIVISRSSPDLMMQLMKDDHPVLFEGLHTSYFLPDERLKGRKLVLRSHNIEHDYYQGLARVEKDIFKRYYFLNEAGKLESYESVLNNATAIAAISQNDTGYFQQTYGNAFYLPAFHANSEITIKKGKGDFVLYHGNLGIGENDEAALFLINKVFDDIDDQLVIAGNKPSKELRAAVLKRPNIRLAADISTAEIHSLIADAQINLLPTFQPTGIKLKLLSALYGGRYCMVNSPMVANTGLQPACIIADTPATMKVKVKELMKKSFSEEEIRKRRDILCGDFSNEINITRLLEQVF
jgi:hypothetical protein